MQQTYIWHVVTGGTNQSYLYAATFTLISNEALRRRLSPYALTPMDNLQIQPGEEW